MRRLVKSLALICSASAAPALADAPTLSLPIDCTLGTSCYIEDYVDLDPGPGQRDYMCAIKSRDGHRGTADIFDRGKTEANRFATLGSGLGGKLEKAGVHIGREDLDSLALTLRNEDGDLVHVVDLIAENPGHELDGIVRLEVGGMITDQAVGS